MDEPDRVRTEARDSDSPTVAQTHFRIGKDLQGLRQFKRKCRWFIYSTSLAAFDILLATQGTLLDADLFIEHRHLLRPM